MRRTLLVAWRSYLQSVRHPAFLVFTIGLPASALALAAFAGLLTVQVLQSDRRPIGYVDGSGLLPEPAAWLASRSEAGWVEMKGFASEVEALQAYASGLIQSYYVVDANYLETGDVKEVSNGLGAFGGQTQFEAFLRDGLLQATLSENRARITSGTTLLHSSIDGGGEQSLQNYLQWGVAGFVVITFWLINSSASSDALYALQDEKKQNTIELSLTAINTEQFIGGKVIGVVAAGATQFAAWALMAAGVVAIALAVLARMGILLSLEPVWGILALSLGLCLPGFAMNVTGLILFSALAELAGRGERVVWAAINLSSLMAGPLTYAALNAPDHPASIALSLLPFSAPLVMVARYAQVVVPAWQVVASLAIVWAVTLVNVLLVARAYKATWRLAGQNWWKVFRAG
jgi:ABC-2 type transport system permease protein